MSAPTPELAKWEANSRYFEYDGDRIAYWTEGLDSGKPPLMLIHGFPTASYDWKGIWDKLAQRYTLIALDMLGFGFSDKPRIMYDLQVQSDIHVALAEKLDLTDFSIVAHDYGVSVAQELLARHNQGIAMPGLKKVLFLNGGLFPDQHKALRIQKLAISPLGPLVSLMMSRNGMQKSFDKIFGPQTQPSETEMDEFWYLISRNKGHRMMHRLMRYIIDRRAHADRWRAALTDAKIPLKLVDGGMDPVSGKHLYEAWKERVPNGEAVLLPDIGHYPQVEAPEKVADEILQFMNE